MRFYEFSLCAVSVSFIGKINRNCANQSKLYFSQNISKCIVYRTTQDPISVTLYIHLIRHYLARYLLHVDSMMLAWAHRLPARLTCLQPTNYAICIRASGPPTTHPLLANPLTHPPRGSSDAAGVTGRWGRARERTTIG